MTSKFTLEFTDERDFARVASILVGAAYVSGTDAIHAITRMPPTVRFGSISAERIDSAPMPITSGMPKNLQAELAKLNQQSQRQDSALAQLRDLHAFANKLGLYDAADLIKNLTVKA